MEQLYFKPPFVPVGMEELLDSMLSTRIGDDWYPGNSEPSDNWPGFSPGDAGVVNAMSGRYFNASDIAQIESKPPLLWLRGAEDLIISDRSVLDVANQGALGNVPGWPGMERCPPQPMLRQTRAVLAAYAARGGSVTEEVIADCGHTPFIEKPGEFLRLLIGFPARSSALAARLTRWRSKPRSCASVRPKWPTKWRSRSGVGSTSVVRMSVVLLRLSRS